MTIFFNGAKPKPTRNIELSQHTREHTHLGHHLGQIQQTTSTKSTHQSLLAPIDNRFHIPLVMVSVKVRPQKPLLI